MKTLLLDNYDSFTFNLYQLIGELGGNPVVHRNDAITLKDVSQITPTHIVISPGPGNPYTARDIGISRQLIEYASEALIPLLGVCLGHQVLTVHFGGTVDRAPKPVHGEASRITFTDPRSIIFQGLPKAIDVMRYHSLCATDVPGSLRVTAATEDGIVMGLEHASLPLFGVQFHPESIGTPEGKAILQQFLSCSQP